MKKVAVLNCWGKMRAWGCHMVHHALYQKQNYSYAGIIESLSGAPFDVVFINFQDILDNPAILDDIDVIINVGDADTAHTGGEWWENPKIIEAIRGFVYNGGGIIGVGEPSGHQYQVRAVLEEKQADILWQISDSFAEDKEKNSMEQSEKVDFIMTLDNISLVAAGECSSTNNLHGAVLYGIGHSMEAFYYLDTGEIQCLVVPDEFNRGYQSVAELSDSLRRFMKKPERNTVSYSTVRRETLFSKENQEVLFTMSQ